MNNRTGEINLINSVLMISTSNILEVTFPGFKTKFLVNSRSWCVSVERGNKNCWSHSWFERKELIGLGRKISQHKKAYCFKNNFISKIFFIPMDKGFFVDFKNIYHALLGFIFIWKIHFFYLDYSH